jgi:EAL domain-containing protein (putative c-di-GMP-specific phosphodiesterase class I)
MRTINQSLADLDLADFQRAADAGQLFLVYQPKLNLRTGEIDSVEALARWHHPTRGDLRPDLFVPIAEENGCIDWLTEWALTCAMRQWRAWKRAGVDVSMAVNISALNLKHVSFPDLVARLCEREAVPARRMTLELTEGATQQAIPLMDTIARLRLKGLAVSLDDFGTGYASMLQLRRLPFTELKIDRSFIADLVTSRESLAITRSLIALAQELGLTVTAEGVEDEETLRALIALGCDRVQGYWVARGMPGDLFPLWISTWRRAPVGRTAGETA